MSYKELAYEFLHYFVNCVNLEHDRLAPCVKQDSMLTINNEECFGENFLVFFNLIKLHNLKIESKHVLVQPIFWKNPTRIDYDGILILASGTTNVLENGIIVNKNVHFNITLENVMGNYYINNIIIRLSEKSRQIQNTSFNHFQTAMEF